MATTAGREAERRQLTVMFVDIVGSVGLSEAMDDEDLRDVIHAYQRVVAEAVEDNEGHIAQYLGDGILAYFGYPVAHEDNAGRAIRAALRSVAGVGQLSAGNPSRPPFAIRIGIHTGIGVIGDVGAGKHHEQLAIGHVLNVAARIQSQAEPNGILVSAETRNLAGDLFAFSAPREVKLKGVTGPVSVSVALSEAAPVYQIGAREKLGLRPLVGRDVELRTLEEQLAQARRGKGRTVLLSGPAGIGKSRLLYAFSKTPREGVLQLSTRCSPYWQNSPLLPLVHLFEQLFDLKNDAGDEGRVRRHSAATADPDAFALLGSFLSLKHAQTVPELNLSSVRRRERTLQVLSDLLISRAAVGPLVVLIEDMHWVDPSTLEFVEDLMERGARTSLLIVLTARPTFESPWGFRPYLLKMELRQLSPAQATEILLSVVGKPIPNAVRDELLAKAEGVPLYLEEMTKAVLESGLLREGSKEYGFNLPSTLRDSLASRLDHLGPAKEIAQLAAVIGPVHFTYDVLFAIAKREARYLRRQLDQLIKAELIELDESAEQETYVFRHALIRDAAYDSLLRKHREELHLRVADLLRSNAEEVASRPDVLAWHLEGAGQLDAAIEAWERAGQFAQARAANREAIASFSRAVSLIAKQPDSAARNPRELGIQLALGAANIATEGWSSPRVLAAFERAHDLCQLIGHSQHVFPALWGLWSYHLVAGHFRDSKTLAAELQRIAAGSDDPKIILPMSHACGYAALFGAEYQQASQVADQALPRFDLERERELCLLYQQSNSIALFNISSMSAWMLGYPEQAKETALKGMAVAKKLEHGPTLVFALASVQWGIGTLLKDTAWVKACAEEALTTCAEIDNVFWPELVRAFRAWACVIEGDHGALDELRQHIDTWRAAGAGVLTTTLYVLLMEAYLVCGRHEEGLQTAATAHAYVAESDERHLEAEVYRLEAELNGADLAVAVKSLDRATDLARTCGARSLELRAAMTRVRLHKGHSGEREALAALAAVYDGFKEGQMTRDLIDARALLGR
jgi:class 3 adenylate cyclase